MAAMGAVSLLQTGTVKHLPAPPIGSFDSGKVNLSETAYRSGAPDGTISLAGLAANIPMPTKQKAWCGYCIVGALCNWGIAALTFPAAKKALDELRGVGRANEE